MFSRLVQGYLAAGRTLDGVLQDARLDVQDERRVRFALENLHDAAAPSNYLLTNPVALRTTVQERGANLVRGARAFASDMTLLAAAARERRRRRVRGRGRRRRHARLGRACAPSCSS